MMLQSALSCSILFDAIELDKNNRDYKLHRIN